jgi:hypothetical protein
MIYVANFLDYLWVIWLVSILFSIEYLRSIFKYRHPQIGDFSQNIDGYVLLVHSFLKWDGILTDDHQMQSPNLLDSGWIELNDGGKLRIVSNIGTSTYNLDNQYAIPPGKIFVLADQNSTLDGIADFASSSPDTSFRVVVPPSIPEFSSPIVFAGLVLSMATIVLSRFVFRRGRIHIE